jgi:FKBP-type peptidyl-prolyl cis-trans isomerase (trigger factor)
VQLALLVPEIAAAEEIKVEEEEVDAKLRELAGDRDVPFNKFRREARERGLIDGIRASLLEERVLEFLVSRATVSES